MIALTSFLIGTARAGAIMDRPSSIFTTGVRGVDWSKQNTNNPLTKCNVMRRFISVALLAAAIVAPRITAQTSQDSIYVEKPVTPHYETFTPETLKAAVFVRSSRSYAVFGYNVPEIVLQMPKVDNSDYASATFDDPVLLDSHGGAVEYERENGIYDHDDFTNEIRMTTDDSKPVAYATAKGAIRLRYPIAIKTHRFKVADASGMKKIGAMVNGTTIRVTIDDSTPEDASFSPIASVRGYDKSGRMIAKESGWQGGMSNGVEYRDYQFKAAPASIEIDRVDDWAGLAIEYELPASPMRDKALAGTVDDPDPLVAATPSGTVTISTTRVLPASVLGDAANMSKDAIAEALADIGYRSIDDEAMMRAATAGKAEAIRLLLAAGISPSGKPGTDTPLHRAASFADIDTIILLINAGADVNARNEVDSTPLIALSNRCSTKDMTDAARALIDAGADVNAKAKGGGSALMMADVLQCSDLASMLRAAGAKEWH